MTCNMTTDACLISAALWKNAWHLPLAFDSKYNNFWLYLTVYLHLCKRRPAAHHGCNLDWLVMIVSPGSCPVQLYSWESLKRTWSNISQGGCLNHKHNKISKYAIRIVITAAYLVSCHWKTFYIPVGRRESCISMSLKQGCLVT